MSLPNDDNLLKEIFGYVDSKGVLALSVVCKRYRDLVKNNSNLWGKLNGRMIHKGKLAGHKNVISCLTVWNGYLVSGSNIQNYTVLGPFYNGSEIRIWGEDLTEVKKLQKHSAGIVALLVWKGKLVSASKDNTINIWNTEWLCEKTIPTDEAVISLSVYKDKLLCSLPSGRIISYDSEYKREDTKFVGGGYGPLGGRMILWENNLVTTYSRFLRFWKDDDSGRYKELQGHTATITSITLWKSTLVSGSLDKTIRLWTKDTAEADDTTEISFSFKSQILGCHEYPIHCVQSWGDKLVSAAGFPGNNPVSSS